MKQEVLTIINIMKTITYTNCFSFNLSKISAYQGSAVHCTSKFVDVK